MPRARRADATQNRDKILRAAQAVFTESSEASTSRVAAAAGVGQATLYRHFATREDLLVAVYETDLDELLALAPTLLADQPPVVALRSWLDRLAGFGRIKRGVLAAVESSREEGLSGRYRERTEAALATLLAGGQASGELRSDVDAADLLAAAGFLWRLPDDGFEVRSARLLDVLLAGLRA